MSEYGLSSTLMIEDKFSVEIDKYKKGLNGIDAATSKTNSTISDIGKDFGVAGVKKIGAFNKSLSNVKNSVSNIGRSSSSGFNRFKNYLTEGEKGASRLDKAVKKMDERMSKIGSKGFDKLTSFASSAAKGIAAVGVATGVMAIKGAADLETYSGMLETAFKGNKAQAQDYYKWANKFANETPYSNAEVIDATVKLSMRGLDPKELLGKIGDMAASLGKPVDQAVEAILDAYTGELERMKEFGITKNDIIKKGEQLGFTDLVNSKGTIVKTKQFADVMFKLMEDRSKGSMEKLSKTFKGKISTLLGVGQSALARFAGIQEDGTVRIGSAFDRIKSKLDEYVGKLNTAIEDGTIDEWAIKFDNFSEKLALAFDEVYTRVTNLTGTDIEQWSTNVGSAFNNIDKIASALASTIEFLNDNMGVLKYGAAAWAGMKTGALAGSVVPGVGTGIGAAVGAVTGIAGIALYDSQNKFNEEQKVLSNKYGTKDTIVRDDFYNKYKENNLIDHDRNKNDKSKGLFSKGIIINITGNNTFSNDYDVKKLSEQLLRDLQDGLLLQQ